MRDLRRRLDLAALALVLACNGDTEPTTGATASESTSTSAESSSTTDGHSSTSVTASTTSTTSTATGETAATTAAQCFIDDACAEDEYCKGDVCAPLCGYEQAILVPIVRPRVAVLVDTSTSMTIADADHDEDPNTPPITRWKLVHDALLAGLVDVDGVTWAAARTTAADASQGYDAGACAVEATPLVGLDAGADAAMMVASFPPAAADAALLRGARPLQGALAAIYDHLRDHDDGNPGAVLLITDGAPNCAAGAGDLAELLEAADPEVEATIAAAYQDDAIVTAVVGVRVSETMSPVTPDMEPDGVSPAAWIDALALAGGFGPALALDVAADGPSVIDTLFSVDSVNIPEFELEHPVPASMTLGVFVGESLVLPLAGDVCDGDGWIFVGPARDTIRLCGAAVPLWEATLSATIRYLCV